MTFDSYAALARPRNACLRSEPLRFYLSDPLIAPLIPVYYGGYYPNYYRQYYYYDNPYRYGYWRHNRHWHHDYDDD